MSNPNNPNTSQTTGAALLPPNLFGNTQGLDAIVQELAGVVNGLAAGGDGGPALDATVQLTQELRQTQSKAETQSAAVQENTRAVDQNTTTRGSGGESTLSKVGGAIGSALGSGLGLSPLFSGILKLFGGENQDASTVEPLLKFSLPDSVDLQAGVYLSQGGKPFGIDYGQGEQPRPVTSAPAQITVQVQAMDSKSFLDHSDDIARAVRQAMLETSVLSDVIREA